VLLAAALLGARGAELLGLFEAVALGLDLDDLARWMSLSTSVTTHAACGNTSPHSEKALLVLSRMGLRAS